MMSKSKSKSGPLRKYYSQEFLKESELRTVKRTPSFSSSSSSLSSASSSQRSNYISAEDSDSPSPPPRRSSTPVRSSGVPFSWEHQPGIPKNQAMLRRQNSDSATGRLPLPPSRAPTPPKSRNNSMLRKLSFNEKSPRDPFIAALVQCSRDEDVARDGGALTGMKLSRNEIGDRLGAIALYTSCKRACAVSESIVRIPSGGRITATPARIR